MSRGHFFSPWPNLSAKEMKETITDTHTQNQQRLHLLHTSLAVGEVISQTNTCYLFLACAHTWVRTHKRAHRHTHTTTMAGSLTHKHTPLCFQTKACFWSFVMIPQKTPKAEREVLTGIWLVIGWKRTNIVLLLSPPLSLSHLSSTLHPSSSKQRYRTCGQAVIYLCSSVSL